MFQTQVLWLEIILDEGADAVVGHLMQIVVVEDAAICGDITVGASRPLILQAEALSRTGCSVQAEYACIPTPILSAIINIVTYSIVLK